MATYIDQFTLLFSQLESIERDAAIPETYKAPILLASINSSCFLQPTAAALRTKERNELTCVYVPTTLIDEYNAKRILLGTAQSAHNRKENRSF